jgi:hypothetical protein
MIACATSLAVPSRPSGTLPLRRSTRSGAPALAWMSVSISPGGDRVDADTFGADLLAEAQRQRIHGSLGRSVPNELAGAAERRRRGGDVDNGPATAAEPRRHPANGLAGDEYRSGDVDVDARLDRRVIGIGKPAGASDHARVIHESGDRPELLVNRAEQLLHVVGRADIRLDRERPAACALDVGDDGRGRLLV